MMSLVINRSGERVYEVTEVLLGTVPDGEQFARISARLATAVALGAVVGLQREREAKPAGLRTHILVTLAATIFVLAPAEAGMLVSDLSRVIQGVATGIGFIGAGAILKLHDEREVKGLTTAATLWVATAIGIAVGLGHVIFAAVAVGFAWITLSLSTHLHARVARHETGARKVVQPVTER